MGQLSVEPIEPTACKFGAHIVPEIVSITLRITLCR